MLSRHHILKFEVTREKLSSKSADFHRIYYKIYATKSPYKFRNSVPLTFKVSVIDTLDGLTGTVNRLEAIRY